MTLTALQIRFADALAESDRGHALAFLAHTLHEEGLSEQVIYELFLERYGALCDSSDQSGYDLVGNVLDRMVGWCAPDAKLFPNWAGPK